MSASDIPAVSTAVAVRMARDAGLSEDRIVAMFRTLTPCAVYDGAPYWNPADVSAAIARADA